MPIYEFSCTDCEAKFEVLVMSRSIDIICPTCGGRGNEREFSVFGMKSIPADGSAGFSSSA